MRFWDNHRHWYTICHILGKRLLTFNWFMAANAKQPCLPLLHNVSRDWTSFQPGAMADSWSKTEYQETSSWLMPILSNAWLLFRWIIRISGTFWQIPRWLWFGMRVKTWAQWDQRRLWIPLGTSVIECVFFSDVGCYHFIGTYARLTFRVHAHNFSLRGSLGGDRLPTQAYAREVLCNF